MMISLTNQRDSQGCCLISAAAGAAAGPSLRVTLPSTSEGVAAVLSF